MSELDELIGNAFDDFAHDAGPSIWPTGTSAVRTTVKRRKTLRATALSVIAAIAVAVPVTAYAVTPHGGQGPPSENAGASTPAISPTTEAPTTPSPSVTTSPSTTPTQSAPDGRITIGQLTSGKVAVPKWTNSISGACKSGKLKLTKGSNVNHDSNQLGLLVDKVVYANLDSDSATETAALVSCQYGEAATDQIVAFDRDAAGHIITLGKVTEGIIWSLSSSSAGVSVDVSDAEACCSTPRAIESHQTRSYAWHGSHFVQVEGPNVFISHSKKNSYQVKVTKAVWSGAPYTPKNSSEVRDLKLTVSITNTSAYTSERLLVWDDSGNSDVGKLGPAVKLAPALKPGTTELVTLTIQWPTDETANNYVLVYELGSIKFATKTSTPYILEPYNLPS